MASITLQFSARATVEGEVIDWFEGGEYDHVDAVLPDGLLGARIGADGAAAPGVQLRPFGYAKFIRTERVTLPATQAQADAWEVWLRSKIGEPYDWEAILGFALDESLHERRHLICSAYQASALMLAPPPWFPRPLCEHPSRITPRDLRLVISPWEVAAVVG
ncbi:MAG: hypothetical protein KGL39_07475 [Patescibacteria group bacterium]|nr:hypothetical protein [Patescibacteria group bacterium]